jgi:drug/metabolite transporter (DMT)-like permease
LIALIFSILASTLIFVIFKLFSKFKINTLHAIVVNYIVACFSGLIAYNNEIVVTNIIHFNWFYYAIGLGAIFILVFNLMALTTQRSGLSVVSVATKMSVVIPIVFGLIYYQESLGVFKLIGIILALIAVYLASIKTKSGIAIQKKNLIYPLLVFIGSGIIDTSIKFLEGSFVAQNDVPIFSATIFASAAVIGILLLTYKATIGAFKFEFKNILGGIALGIPNYFSIYFLVQALRSNIFDSSGIFTVNNVAIVMVSTIAGIILFKEKLLIKNWIGIALAIISIFMVTLSKY